MHASLCVKIIGLEAGSLSSVVLGLGLGRWSAAEAVMSLPVLYQCTQAEVQSSRSARPLIGPVRNGESCRTHSIL